MNKPLTLGSLFDGSGTFPMMAMLAGIMPVWKSEIEPVDIIAFGSPCTDLFVCSVRNRLLRKGKLNIVFTTPFKAICSIKFCRIPNLISVPFRVIMCTTKNKWRSNI